MPAKDIDPALLPSRTLSVHEWQGAKPWRIWFFPDYSADSPFWGPSGLWPIEELPLSAELSADIGAWNDYWETNHHWERGWDASVDVLAWATHGRALCVRAQIELGPDYVLVYKISDA